MDESGGEGEEGEDVAEDSIEFIDEDDVRSLSEGEPVRSISISSKTYWNSNTPLIKALGRTESVSSLVLCDGLLERLALSPHFFLPLTRRVLNEVLDWMTDPSRSLGGLMGGERREWRSVVEGRWVEEEVT